jgi:lysophospholipase L1-like esterase
MRSLLRALIITLAMSALLVALLEGGTRVYLRLAHGRWPQTFASILRDARDNSNRIFRAHPFLNAGPREGASTTGSGRTMSFNRAGYRSPERERHTSAGAFRIVTAGGSTTFDLCVPRDQDSWPWQLETRLRDGGVDAEVWNAGFPGWTSLENVISLVIRDVDLRPDVLILYQGINDLQPAAHVPFDPQYEDFHARTALVATGIAEPPLAWYERSVFLEKALPVARRWSGIAPAAAVKPPPLERVPQPAVEVFERNVRSFIAVGRAFGARTVLVTQPLRPLTAWRPLDSNMMELWIPGLTPDAARRELDRFNDVLRRLAADGEAELADAARDVRWTADDFFDAMHFAAPGARKLADFLAPIVARLRPAPERDS